MFISTCMAGPTHGGSRVRAVRAAKILIALALACLAVASSGVAQTALQEGPTLARIGLNGTVRVCIWPDYHGISFRSPRTGQLSGIDIDLAIELGKALNAKVVFVDSSFANLMADLEGDRCDVAMFAIGITPARMARLRFTRPHLASDVYAITTRTNRRIQDWADIDRPGTVVAVAKGTLHEPVMRERLRNAQLLVLDTPFAREQEVQSGRADVFMTDFPYSQRFLASVDWARLVAPPSPFHITPYAFAVKPGDDHWLAFLNRFVETIKGDGRLVAAAQRHGLQTVVVK